MRLQYLPAPIREHRFEKILIVSAFEMIPEESERTVHCEKNVTSQPCYIVIPNFSIIVHQNIEIYPIV